jgi:zinc protease
MKAFNFTAAVALTCLLAAPALGAPAGDDGPKVSIGEKEMEAIPVPSLQWSVPEVGREVTRETLSGGSVLYVYPDHRVPLVNVLFQFRAGAFEEPVERAGLANMVLNLIRTGGTAEHAYQEIDRALDELAARVTVSPGDEAAGLTLNVLRKNLDPALALVAEMIREPAFPRDRIDFRKEEVRSAIRRQNDNPRQAVTREFTRAVFGDHPYGRSPEWERVRAITAGDLRQFHDRFYVPGNLFIAVTGDVTPDEARAALEKALSGWTGAAPELPPVPPEKGPATPPVFLLYQKDLTQTAIAFGRPGLDRSSPDIYTGLVLNHILGGGSFTSRLGQEVRDRAGLAYSVRSSLPIDRRDPGPFVIECQTKTASTLEALRLMRAIVSDMAEAPVPADRFQGAQDALVNGFVRGFADPENVVEALMNLEFEGRPPDFYRHYLNHVRAVTPAEVQTLAARLCNPKTLVTVMVGNVASLRDSLADLGTVEVRTPEEQDLD